MLETLFVKEVFPGHDIRWTRKWEEPGVGDLSYSFLMCLQQWWELGGRDKFKDHMKEENDGVGD